MSESSDDIANRANDYVTTRGIRLERLIGFGREARVYGTGRRTAIKIHDDFEAFQRELLCYIRLVTLEITEVLGHQVPKLFDADERLMVLELTVVERPFLLDFGAARLDSAPDFPADVLETWEQEKIEQFGDHWPHTAAIIDWLRVHAGIYLLDVHPGNIGFPQ
ncbi:MAG TPA: hypothetical protein VIM11_00110 [Tepidisphaeraceae bacterium]|jgi:hypothetical protein